MQLRKVYLPRFHSPTPTQVVNLATFKLFNLKKTIVIHIPLNSNMQYMSGKEMLMFIELIYQTRFKPLSQNTNINLTHISRSNAKMGHIIHVHSSLLVDERLS